jgi:glycine/D-amino acid oxidase-like deaminating enzyme
MQNVDRDIVVIGAGGCGLMATLVAAKKGARVLLLEKTDKPGGGTAFSSKGNRAAGSRRPRELKIDDSEALYARDILQRNNGESDAVIIRRLAETSGRVADFLTDEAASGFKSASLPSGTARSDHTHGRRIRPSPISCVKLYFFVLLCLKIFSICANS